MTIHINLDWIDSVLVQLAALVASRHRVAPLPGQCWEIPGLRFKLNSFVGLKSIQQHNTDISAVGQTFFWYSKNLKSRGDAGVSRRWKVTLRQ